MQLRRKIMTYRIGTLILDSKRLNIGAFLSMSGITINLIGFPFSFKQIEVLKKQTVSSNHGFNQQTNSSKSKVPDFTASDKNMLKL